MVKKISFVLFFLSNLAFSQTLKIGYVYEDYIIGNFKETKTLQADLETRRKNLETQLQTKAKEYQEKYAVYQNLLKDVSNTTNEDLNAKLKEVQNLQEAYSALQKKGEEELQNLAQTKIIEIQQKVRKAIDAVAKEKGYKFVVRKNVNGSVGETTPFLLYSANTMNDLTDAVLVKLGTIPPKK